MIRNIFILIFSFHICYAADLSNFDTRQDVLKDIKRIVQNEESIARAYEQYILDNYDIPSNILALYTSDYLGTSSDFLSVITNPLKDSSKYFHIFSLGLSDISYGLTDILTDDGRIKILYESSTFRKRTYYRDNKIQFVLKDAFAKHLFDLIHQKGSGLSTCIGLAGISCIKDNHIYINPTYTLLDITGYLMNYHIDNFKKGPIIIGEEPTLQAEFRSIPRGAFIMDRSGKRYVKTTTSIKALQ